MPNQPHATMARRTAGMLAPLVPNAARAIVPTIPRPRRGGVSHWDASGLFSDLMVAPPEAGTPSARTLLLFYAAEKDVNPKVRTIWDASIYVTTCLSVGYADIFARTPVGKLIGLEQVLSVETSLHGLGQLDL